MRRVRLVPFWILQNHGKTIMGLPQCNCCKQWYPRRPDGSCEKDFWSSSSQNAVSEGKPHWTRLDSSMNWFHGAHHFLSLSFYRSLSKLWQGASKPSILNQKTKYWRSSRPCKKRKVSKSIKFDWSIRESNWQMTKLWSRTTLVLEPPFTWSCNWGVDQNK